MHLPPEWYIKSRVYCTALHAANMKLSYVHTYPSYWLLWESTILDKYFVKE